MRKKVFVLLITLLFLGCNFKNQNNLSVEKKKPNSPSLTEMEWKDYDEILFILSQKYQIDSLIVKPLVIEYLRIQDPLKYFTLTIDYPDKDTTVLNYILKPKEKVSFTMQRLSQQYSIESSKLSSFIYDFKVYDKLLRIEEKCDNVSASTDY